MKIKDLIKELEKYNPEADITLPISEDICLSYISESIDGKNYSQNDTVQVFIEGADSCPSCTHEYIDDCIRMCSFYHKPCKLVEECYAYEEFIE